MKRFAFGCLAVLPLAAIGQTTTTNCLVNGQWISCQSNQIGSRPPAVQVNPNAFMEGFQRAQELRQRESEARMQQELLRQQAENVRLQNDSLRRQQSAAAAETPAPPSWELISAEAALIRRAFFDIEDKQMLLPAEQRLTQDQFAAALGARIQSDLGREPRPESFNVAIEQVKAIKADRAQRDHQ